jgi:hypothetical protein
VRSETRLAVHVAVQTHRQNLRRTARGLLGTGRQAGQTATERPNPLPSFARVGATPEGEHRVGYSWGRVSSLQACSVTWDYGRLDVATPSTTARSGLLGASGGEPRLSPLPSRARPCVV